MRDILDHAKEDYPNEIAGVISEGRYYQCRNIAADPLKESQMHPADYKEFEGKIEALVHSHPDASSKMSGADKVMMEFFKIPYVIVGYPNQDFGVYVPTGYKAPLIGRKFYHGVLDCYTLIRDFYDRELGIAIPDFERDDKWWEKPNAASLYEDNFASAGFMPVNDLQYGDVLITTYGDSLYPNHALVYLASQGQLKSEETSEAIGASMMMHHMYGRKSSREVYGEDWRDRTKLILRHKDLI